MAATPGNFGFLETIGRIPARALVALMVMGAATIAVAIGAWLWAHEPDYRVLYSNVSDRDGGAIIAALSQLNVPYKFAEGGGAILVPSTLVHDTRLRLASQGLPKGGTVGFELMENQRLGATQFQEQVNYQRGLEGELAKSIQSLSAVQAARVHVAIPRATAFLRDQQGPSASVLVSLNTGKVLDRAQVNGIRHLVASSVPELTVDNVSVIDQNGTLLSADGAEAGSDHLDPSQLAYLRQVEQATVARIEGILEPIVGPDNARVQVSADVDFLSVESVAETYAPNQDPKNAAVRNQQSTQSSTSTAAGAQGVPGALSNQPPANGTAAIDAKPAAPGAPAAPPTSLRKDEAISYEVDKTIKHTKSPVGSVKRMSAAVVINFRKQTDDKGKVTMVARSPEQLEQINALVREAMGFSKERGDSLNVVNAAFSEPEHEVVVETPFWKAPDTIALAKELGKYTAFSLLVGYLFFGVFKPMLKKAVEVRALPAPEATLLPAMALVPGNAGADPLLLARKLAREDPKIVANVVKSWVTKDEG